MPANLTTRCVAPRVQTWQDLAMSANEALVRRFYEAFSRRDATSMAACYAPDVRFSDPVFVGLKGREAGDMWAMLCEQGKDLQVRLASCEATDEGARARWIADYTFGPTRRKVHNEIDAVMVIRDGLIVEHTDAFDLRGWLRQALGVPGALFGWSSLLQNKLRSEARKGLKKYQAKR